MRKIKIDKISFEILKQEHIENLNEFLFICAEAEIVEALDFFDIAFDENERTLSIPDSFNFEDALNIVNAYLEIVEADEHSVADINGAIEIPSNIIEEEDYVYRISKEAMRYDEHTKPNRGADDGTYDYAGTFVISILSVLQSIFN